MALNNQDHFVKWCIGCSILATVYITLADLNCQNDVRESSESAEKRTKKQIYLSEQFCQAGIFLCKLLFLQSLIFSGSWSMVLIHPDRASPSDVRPSDLPPSHRTYFDTFFINTNASNLRHHRFCQSADEKLQLWGNASPSKFHLQPTFPCAGNFQMHTIHFATFSSFLKWRKSLWFQKLESTCVQLKLFGRIVLYEIRIKVAFLKICLPITVPKKQNEQTSNIGEMILYAYFNMNHDSNDSKKHVKIIWVIEFE